MGPVRYPSGALSPQTSSRHQHRRTWRAADANPAKPDPMCAACALRTAVWAPPTEQLAVYENKSTGTERATPQRRLQNANACADRSPNLNGSRPSPSESRANGRARRVNKNRREGEGLVSL